jgi:mRNA interferase RelE/StbE
LAWTIRFDQRALKELKKIDKQAQRDILAYLYKHIETNQDPCRFGKELKGKLKGLWRYRTGDYRIVCDIRDNELIVLILRVAHRRKVYI